MDSNSPLNTSNTPIEQLPADALESSTVSSSADQYGNWANSSSLETTDTVQVHGQNQPEAVRPVAVHSLSKTSMLFGRKSTIVSIGITLLVTMLTGVSILTVIRQSNKAQEKNRAANQQDVSLKDATISDLPSELHGSARSLYINGDVITRGVLKVTNGEFSTTIKASPTANQTFTLPDSSGVFCLDTNNCAFASVAELQGVQDQFGQTVSSVNGQSGAIEITGAAGILVNGTVVSNSGVLSIGGQTGEVALASGDGVTVSGTTISNSGVLSVGGQVGALNVGSGISAAGGTISNTGVLSVGGQTGVVTVGLGLLASGGNLSNTGVISLNSPNNSININNAGNGVYELTAGAISGVVSLGPASAQADPSNNNSIFINKTGTGNLLHFEVNGVDKFILDQSGIIGTAYGGTGVNGSNAANGKLLIGNGTGFSIGSITASTNPGTIITVTENAGGIVIGNTAIDCATCANTALSNLAATTSVSSDLGAANATIDLGRNTAPFGELYLAGSTGSSTNNFKITGTPSGGVTTLNLPSAGGTTANFCISTNNCNTVLLSPAGTQTGSIDISGNVVAAGFLQSTLLKSTDGAGSGTTPALVVRSGNAGGGNTSSGNVTIDVGTKSGTGTAGQLELGLTNASQVKIGRTGAAAPKIIIQGSGGSTSDSVFRATNGVNSTSLYFSTISGNVDLAIPNIAGSLAVVQASGATVNQTGDLRINGDIFASSIKPIGGTNLSVGAGAATDLAIQGNFSSDIVATNGTRSVTLSFQVPTSDGNVNLQFPDLAAGGTYEICVSAANCPAGGGNAATVATGGYADKRLTRFTGTTNEVTASILEETSSSSITLLNATNVGTLIVQGTGSFAGGASSGTQSITLGSESGSLVGGIQFNNGTNGFNATLQAGATSADYTLKLPTDLPSSSQCLSTDNTGQIGYAACGGSGNGTVTSTGNQGYIALFTDSGNPSLTIGNSILSQTSGRIGLNTTPDSSAVFSVGATNTHPFTVASTGAVVAASLDLNGGGSPGGITNTGSIADATTISASGLLTLSGNGNIIKLSGSPAAGVSSLLLSSTELTSGSANGTYIGVNPAVFNGNFVEFQVGGASKLVVTSAGNVVGGTFNGVTLSTATANQLDISGNSRSISLTGNLTVTGNSTLNQDLTDNSSPTFNGLTLDTTPLALASGGTNTNSLTANGVALVNGAGDTLTALVGVTTGHVLTWDGSSWVAAATGGGSCAGCANKSLNNLENVGIAISAGNQELAPATAGLIDLGGVGKAFQDLYLAGGVIDGNNPGTNYWRITGADRTNGGLIDLTLPAIDNSTFMVLQGSSSVAQGASTDKVHIAGSYFGKTLELSNGVGTVKTSDNSGNSTQNLNIQSGDAGNSSQNSGAVSIKTGSTGLTSTSGSILLQSGDASTGGTSGNITLEVGTATTNGRILFSPSKRAVIAVGTSTPTAGYLVDIQGNLEIGSTGATETGYVNLTGNSNLLVGIKLNGGQGGTGNYLRYNATCACYQSGAIDAADLPGGSNAYIKNDTAQQTSANFFIDGTGKASTALQSPTIDAIVSGALSIGTTNASSIDLKKNTNLTGNLSFSNGSDRTINIATAASGNGNSLTLQGGNAFASGNTNGGDVYLLGGTKNGTGRAGDIYLAVTSGNVSQGRVSIGTNSLGASTDLLTVAGTATFQGSGSNPTLILGTASTAGVASTAPGSILLRGGNATSATLKASNATTAANLDWTLPATATPGTGNNCLGFSASSTQMSYLSCLTSGGGGAGGSAITLSGTATANRLTKFVGPASSDITASNVSDDGTIVKIQNSTPLDLLSINTSTSVIVIGNSGNTVTFGSGFEPVLAGNARHIKTVSIIPEYAGAVLNGTGIGTLTADFCSGTSKRSINTTVCTVSSDEHNYYTWTTSLGAVADQVYDIWVRQQIPDDFDKFSTAAGADADATNRSIKVAGWGTDSNQKVQVSLYRADGTLCGTGNRLVSSTNGSWATTDYATGSDNENSCGITGGSVVTFKIRMTANSIDSTKFARVGAITFNYRGKY